MHSSFRCSSPGCQKYANKQDKPLFVANSSSEMSDDEWIRCSEDVGLGDSYICEKEESKSMNTDFREQNIGDLPNMYHSEENDDQKQHNVVLEDEQQVNDSDSFQGKTDEVQRAAGCLQPPTPNSDFRFTGLCSRNESYQRSTNIIVKNLSEPITSGNKNDIMFGNTVIPLRRTISHRDLLLLNDKYGFRRENAESSDNDELKLEAEMIHPLITNNEECGILKRRSTVAENLKDFNDYGISNLTNDDEYRDIDDRHLNLTRRSATLPGFYEFTFDVSNRETPHPMPQLETPLPGCSPDGERPGNKVTGILLISFMNYLVEIV